MYIYVSQHDVKLFVIHYKNDFMKPFGFKMTHVSRPGLGYVQAVSLEPAKVRKTSSALWGVCFPKTLGSNSCFIETFGMTSCVV